MQLLFYGLWLHIIHTMAVNDNLSISLILIFSFFKVSVLKSLLCVILFCFEIFGGVLCHCCFKFINVCSCNAGIYKPLFQPIKYLLKISLRKLIFQKFNKQCWEKLLLKVMHYIALLPKKVTDYVISLWKVMCYVTL